MLSTVRSLISRGLLLLVILVAAQLPIVSDASAQGPPAAVVFSFEQQRTDEGQVLLRLTARPRPGIKLYDLRRGEEDAVYSEVRFDSAVQARLVGGLTEQGTLRKEHDPVLGSPVRYVADSVTWQQVIQASVSDSLVVKGAINYMYLQGDVYMPGEQSFTFYIQPEAATLKSRGGSPGGGLASRSLLWIFLAAFGGGLLALLTPCVYSMIPVTVSFFTKRSRNRREGVRNALWYAASIILIFTGLGFLITLVFGPAALNNLSTNWVANLVFFALFFLFGISFLGAFEITLPAAWSTKTDTKAGLGSFMGIFFMALTLVMVSFSCTGPIIGNLLVLAAKGSYWGPLVGMAGFSLALALPFALFAFFPSKLNVLGKAGGWLNAVKVTLGFLELALALKFLSNADLARGWRLLDREVFLALWIVLFALLGLYLLGKLKLHHDDEQPRNDFGVPYVGVTRLMLAILTLSFVVFLIPGLWGAPLKGISAFLPPMGTQDFNASAPAQAVHLGAQDAALRPKKYYESMRVYEPEVVTKYGMVTYFDYEEALAAARTLKKPLMLDFTGINCVNCRKMEGEVWSDPAVMKRLKEDFVIASLYVDVQQVQLPPQEQYYSQALGKTVETLGDKWADFQVTTFGANSQPYYFFLDGHEQRLLEEGYGYDPNVDRFVDLLEQAKQQYQKRN